MFESEYLNTRAFYTLKERISSKMYELITPDLTLDLKSETGFKELDIVKPWQTDIKDDCEKTITDLDSLCQTLLSLLQESIQKCWNPLDKHLVFISGGADSRLICYIIKKLGEVNGKDWIGEIKFLTRYERSTSINPLDSTTIVKSLMEKLGWPFLEARSLEFSPYLIPNAFSEFKLNFYHPLSLDYKELKKWVGVSGNYGGEQTHYPAYKGFTNDRFSDLNKWLSVPNTFTFPYHAFKDHLQPYLYKPYMRTVFKIHPSLFVMKKISGERTEDVIRGRMLKMLGDTLPLYTGHQYEMTSKEDVLTKVQELWDNSLFKKDFSKQLDSYKKIRITNIWDKAYVESKLFGLAMTYDFGKKEA